MHISKFILEQGHTPLNPFMLFDYFLADTVDRQAVRDANNNIVTRADEVWVFGPVSDGVLAEIRIAKEHGKPIRYFEIVKSREIAEIQKADVAFEDELAQFAHEL